MLNISAGASDRLFTPATIPFEGVGRYSNLFDERELLGQGMIGTVYKAK